MEKIFLVEDDANFGSVLKAYLEMNDYEVSWVDDGSKALGQFNTGKYNFAANSYTSKSERIKTYVG